VEASMSSLGYHHQFNQLFNFVNYVDQIELDPFSAKKVIIAFLPDEKQSDHGLEQRSEHFQMEGETFDYAEINGAIFFVCFKDVKKMDQRANTVPDKSVASTPRSDSKSFEIYDASQIIQPDFQVDGT
jgi:hypothetical protein